MTGDNDFRSKIEKAITTQYDERLGNLRLSEDWGDFRYRAGYLQALKDAKDWIQQAAREAFGG